MINDKSPGLVTHRLSKGVAMKFFSLIIAVCLVAAVIGCGAPSPEVVPEPTPEVVPPAPAPEPEPPPEVVPPAPEPEPPEVVPPAPAPEPPEVEPLVGTLSFTLTPDIESKLVDSNWISPGKVMIGNLFPGARAEYLLTVHNGNDVETPFALTVIKPHYVAEGYQPMPEEYYSWITISDAKPVIAPKQSMDILIVVVMPDDVSYPGQKIEFWISVIDQGQSEMIRTELVSRCLISTQE